MRLWRQLLRILGCTLLATFALLLVVGIAVQIQQHIFRHRAERLLADFHSIHLRETTWPEAKAIMQKWGTWGYAEGPCTKNSCSYTIHLQAPLVSKIWEAEYAVPFNYIRWKLFLFLDNIGAHPARFDVHFQVTGGTVVQSAVVFTTLSDWSGDEYNYGADIGFIAQSKWSLRSAMLWHAWNQMEQPHYRIGRPAGCMNCELGFITYTPYASKSDIDHLTDFRFDCITQIRSCKSLTELLPASVSWHLYDYQSEQTAPSTVNRSVVKPPSPCVASPLVTGRDEDTIAEVDALTSSTERLSSSSPLLQESDTVRLLTLLKGTSEITPNSVFTVKPYVNGSDSEDDPNASEHLTAGHRYLIILNDRLELGAQTHTAPCGVLDDTPQIRGQVLEGIAERGTMKDPDFHPEWW